MALLDLYDLLTMRTIVHSVQLADKFTNETIYASYNGHLLNCHLVMLTHITFDNNHYYTIL